MKKRLGILFLLLLMVISLSSCGGESKLAPYDLKISQFTESMNASLAKLGSSTKLTDPKITEVEKNGKKYSSYSFTISDGISLSVSPNNKGEYTFMVSLFTSYLTVNNAYDKAYQFTMISRCLTTTLDSTANFTTISDAINFGEMDSETQHMTFNGNFYAASGDGTMISFYVAKTQ